MQHEKVRIWRSWMVFWSMIHEHFIHEIQEYFLWEETSEQLLIAFSDYDLLLKYE